jgi:hypothetical protein
VIDDIDFNIFEYSSSYGRENVLINIADYIFDKYSFKVFLRIFKGHCLDFTLILK